MTDNPKHGSMPAGRLAPPAAWLASLLGALLMAACGGGGGSSEPPPPVVEPAEVVPNPAGPGQFKEASLLKSITSAEIAAAVASAPRAPAVTPRYAVNTYRINYLTLDGQGREILASGLVAVPAKAAEAKSPVLSYQHATITKDAEAPSNHAVADEAAVVMASTGYIVLASDYVGYGVSKGAPHPYLMSAPSASAVLDLLTAARYWRYTQNLKDNKQLFLAGYSEGGYVTMAAHRALQTGKHAQLPNLVSVSPGAGAYNVNGTFDDLLRRVKEAEPVLGTLLNPGFLKLLGDSDRRNVRNLLLRLVLDGDTDVVFQPTFLDNYLADDTAAVNVQSNVHDWKPEVQVKLYHGKDDRTVPYLNSTSALQAMQARGSTVVTLTDCPSQPSGHIDCVIPYWNFMLAHFGTLAKDL